MSEPVDRFCLNLSTRKVSSELGCTAVITRSPLDKKRGLSSRRGLFERHARFRQRTNGEAT